MRRKKIYVSDYTIYEWLEDKCLYDIVCPMISVVRNYSVKELGNILLCDSSFIFREWFEGIPFK